MAKPGVGSVRGRAGERMTGLVRLEPPWRDGERCLQVANTVGRSVAWMWSGLAELGAGRVSTQEIRARGIFQRQAGPAVIEAFGPCVLSFYRVNVLGLRGAAAGQVLPASRFVGSGVAVVVDRVESGVPVFELGPFIRRGGELVLDVERQREFVLEAMLREPCRLWDVLWEGERAKAG